MVDHLGAHACLDLTPHSSLCRQLGCVADDEALDVGADDQVMRQAPVLGQVREEAGDAQRE